VHDNTDTLFKFSISLKVEHVCKISQEKKQEKKLESSTEDKNDQN